MIYLPTVDIINEIARSYAMNKVVTGSGYVAPAIFLKAGAKVTRWNYYKSKADALKKLYKLTNTPGGSDPVPAGAVTFKADGSAQTFGINADFYFPLLSQISVPVPYNAIGMILQRVGNKAVFIAKFYRTTGTGPFYAVIDFTHFSISANVVKAAGDKLAAIDALQREVALIKATYNFYTNYLNELAAKPFLNPAEQQSYNRANNIRQAMWQEMQQIKDVQFVTMQNGQIGLPVLPLIAWIVIGLGVTIAAASVILKEVEKSKRIRQSYDHQKFLAAEQKKILDGFAAGQYTKEQAQAALKNIGIAMQTADTVAKETVKDKGVFDNLADIAKFGMIAVIVLAVTKMSNN